ncbi:hypothetical protein M426DRAFT_7580 [Hypoxylon sp. CI-4A]|nr:hypothetical protein M426DRAFT_7580 [Hypoxylon sp. CI-4A]
MVGFVERFRKPKSSIPPPSPRRDGVAQGQTRNIPRQFAPPVLRNFSYPTNVGKTEQPPPFPSASKTSLSTWDQLGEICSFSPDNVSRTGHVKTFALDDPFFFFRSEPEPYNRLDDDESGDYTIGISSEPLFERESPSQEEPKTRKKQRRSTLLGLPSSRAQSPLSL